MASPAASSAPVGLKIVTEFVYPPIPIRSCDWAAYVDGYEPGDPCGHGATKQEAIDDLLDFLADADIAA